MSRNELQLVHRNATCKRCDSTDVTWQTGASGKWFLTEVFVYDGIEKTSYRDFHSTYCGKRELHDAKQGEITRDELNQQRAQREAAEKREAERLSHEADLYVQWMSMTDVQRETTRVELVEKKRRATEGITMDYMTEWSRAVAESEAIQNEIDLLDDFCADLETEA